VLFRLVDSACNICGGVAFGNGPGGRLSSSGKSPRCEKCDSLERHRALRRLYERLPAGALSWRRGLQFSADVSIRPEWFNTYEISIYGGSNSLDLNRIERADGAYDFITANMVLEFIPDARKGFRELARILSVGGLLQIGFSNAGTRGTTLDYDEAQGSYQAGQGYFHLFGRDLNDYFELKALGVTYIELEERDYVTDTSSTFHFFSKDPADLATLEREIVQSHHLFG
jgi:hypothetical protein